MKPYKFQLVEELQPGVLQQRRSFAEWVLDNLNEDPICLLKSCLQRRRKFLAQLAEER